MKKNNYLLLGAYYSLLKCKALFNTKLRYFYAFIAFLFLSTLSSYAADVVVPFTTPGATTWTCPAGVTTITVECWGGGGAGGGGWTTDSKFVAYGGGGAGGGYTKKVLSVTPGVVYNLTVGAGGTSIAPTAFDNNTDAASGQASYFIDAYTVNANGGLGGKMIYSSANVYGDGAAFNPDGQIGDLTYNGGNGAKGYSTQGRSGTGGGSAGISSNGNNGSTTPTTNTSTPAVAGGGYGGSSSNTVGTKFSGGSPGGGGGGAKAKATSLVGGNGGNGQITITYTTDPKLYLTATTLSGFSYVYGSGSSTSQSLSISGSNLTGFTNNLTVTAPTDYEVSLDNVTFASSVLVEFTSSTLDATTLYVRLKEGLSSGNYNSENISITGGGLATASTITCSGSVSDTYTWNGSISTDGQEADNWTPSRTTTVAGDILEFSSGGSVTVTNVVSQTLDQLLISNNTAVELQASTANAVISILGGSGTGLTIPAGSSLTLGGSLKTIKINLATGATGTIGGNVTFTGTDDTYGLNHQITAADVDAIHFTSGAIMTAGTNFTLYPFGVAPNGAVVFESGSSYIHNSGNVPFGGFNLINVVTFNPGSLYKFTGLVGGVAPAAATIKPGMGDKIYANYEIATETTIANANPSGNVTFENMVVNGTSFSISANSNGATTIIKGNVTIGTGGGITFGIGTAVSPVIFSGSSPQTITLTDNGLFTIGASSVMSVDNDLTLDGDVTLSGTVNVAAGKTLTIAAGKTLTMAAGSILNIASGATLTIAATGKLTNNGTMTNNGTLNLLSSASGNATLVSVGTINGSGTSNVNQYLPSYRSWYLSSPVLSATPADVVLIKKYDETSNTWSDNLASMNAKTGYQVNPTNSDPIVSNIEFSGALNHGDLDIPLTSRTGAADKAGFNLIGNPYPCYLDWNLVMANSANATLLRSTTMWYRTKLNDAFTFWTVNGEGVGTPTTANKYIPPMQAFWVRANEGVGNLAFTTDMLSHGPTTDKLLKAPAATSNTNKTILRLQVNNGINTDETVIYLSDKASNSLDTYDSPKMTNDNVLIPEIYTVVGAEQLVINSMNTIPVDSPIGMGFVAGSATSFSIKANEISNLPSNLKVILRDNVNKNETDLTDGVATYQFNTESTSSERFSVIFRSADTSTDLNNTVENSVLVYTNALHQLLLNCNSDLIGARVEVFNTVGQKILSKTISTTQMQISNKLTQGMYVVKVNEISNKIIIR